MTNKMFAALVAVGKPRARELYQRMRTPFNLARPPGFLEVPPWEEWRGVSIFATTTHADALLLLLLFSFRSCVHRSETAEMAA